jgi:peptidoglycan/xylan/chitin deacetylase (PgdA/CDA1 family)
VATIRDLHPHEVLPALPAGGPPAVACVTLDFEADYGARTGDFEALTRTAELEGLRALFVAERVPLTLFVVTGLLDRFAAAGPTALALGDDWHAHSHTHAVDDESLAAGIPAAAARFARWRGRPPLGYRAPMGLLRPEDVPRLRAAGYRFSASVFPSLRPGRFDHRRAPTTPLRYANGLVELPFGVVRGLRLPVSVSYAKLLGPGLLRGVLRAFGLPPVVVVNLHLHDVLDLPASRARLPRALEAVYRLNRGGGLAALRALLAHLRGQGYTFSTMTDLYELCAGARPGADETGARR